MTGKSYESPHRQVNAVLLELNQPRLRQEQAPSVLHLVRLALELGAGDFGGPLSVAELGVLRRTRELPRPTAEELGSIREEVLAGGDPLGQAFIRIVPPEVRRPLGAVYTPASIVKPMVAWIMGLKPVRVVDPGAGSGRFSLRAASHDPRLEIVAVDADPIATLICRANLRLAGAMNARVVQGDYLDLHLAPVKGRTAFVGNPPYVRHHELSPETKDKARRMATSLNRSVSGLAGLHAHFIIATAIYAQTGDVGCFITSAEWLDVGYGSVVRELLSAHLGLRSLHLLDPRSIPFDGTMTTAVISCFEVGGKTENTALRFVDAPDSLAGLDVEDPKTPLAKLARLNRWSGLFETATQEGSSSKPREGSVPLGSLVRVSRGVATGANDFFVMTPREAEWRGLSRFARPAITRAQEVFAAGEIIHLDPGRKVIVDLPGDLDLEAPGMEAVRAFIREGEARGIHQRYLCTHRRPWWRLGIGQAPRVVATYMARQAPAFALNPDGLAIVNVVHGFYPREPLTDDELFLLVQYLNKERVSHRGKGRTYHGGLEKFEPREMEALLVPPMNRLREGM